MEAVRLRVEGPEPRAEGGEGAGYPLVAAVRLGGQRVPEPDRLLRDGLAGAGRVATGLPQGVVERDRAAIPEADGVPAAGLADDAEVGRRPCGDARRAGGAHRLLAHRPHDRHAGVQRRGRERGGGGEGRERPLGVDRSPPVEDAVLDPDRDDAGDRVDMPEEHDVPGAVSDGPDGVPGGVDLGPEATRRHLAAELLHRGALVAGGARDRDQATQQGDVCQVVLARRQRVRRVRR